MCTHLNVVTIRAFTIPMVFSHLPLLDPHPITHTTIIPPAPSLHRPKITAQLKNHLKSSHQKKQSGWLHAAACFTQLKFQNGISLNTIKCVLHTWSVFQHIYGFFSIIKFPYMYLSFCLSVHMMQVRRLFCKTWLHNKQFNALVYLNMH